MELLIDIDGGQFQSESRGENDSPPVILIPGAPVAPWPEAFCQTLVMTGCRLICYDDSGVDDRLQALWAVADGYGLEAFHLVGMASGGLLAQQAALARSERILSLTLIATWAFEPSADRLSEITTPALILHGAEDQSIDVGQSRVLAGWLPNARLSLLEGVGHELPEKRLPEILTEVLNFLAEQHR